MYDKLKNIVDTNETVVAIVAAASMCQTCTDWIPSVLKTVCAEFDVSVNIINDDFTQFIINNNYSISNEITQIYKNVLYNNNKRIIYAFLLK